jgi:hypothetical protein
MTVTSSFCLKVGEFKAENWSLKVIYIDQPRWFCQDGARDW